MKPKSIKITYRIMLILLCAFTTFDGIGGITKQQAGVDALHHLGYPDYIMPLFGALKLLGVFALLQPWFQGIKEWVFAGLAFTFIGASVSHICSHDPVLHIVMPLIFLTYLLIARALWLKYEAVKNAA